MYVIKKIYTLMVDMLKTIHIFKEYKL